MKKYSLLFLAGLLTLFAWSCQTDELLKFEGGEAYIFIHRPRQDVDTYFEQRRNIAGTDHTLPYIVMSAPVRIAGDVTDYDRPIAFELTTPNLGDYYVYIHTFVRDENGDFVYIDVMDEDGNPIYDAYGDRVRERKWERIRDERQSGRGAGFPLMVEGRDIELLPSYIPAGRNSGVIRVRVNNTQFIQENWGLAVVTLNANEHFNNNFLFLNSNRDPDWDQRLRFYFFATNSTEQPRMWAGNPSPFNNTVGTWSVVKYQLMMQIGGFDDTLLNTILEDEITRNEDGEIVSINYSAATNRAIGGTGGLTILARAMLYYLTNYYEQTGQWMRDEHGHEIRMHPNISL